jgi:carbon storage regulator CsrA
MLVVTRQVNEKIMIGDNIVVTIIRIEQGQVR